MQCCISVQQSNQQDKLAETGLKRTSLIIIILQNNWNSNIFFFDVNQQMVLWRHVFLWIILCIPRNYENVLSYVIAARGCPRARRTRFYSKTIPTIQVHVEMPKGLLIITIIYYYRFVYFHIVFSIQTLRNAEIGNSYVLMVLITHTSTTF